jgi:AhpD family alkylhydroperoxidase
MELGAIVGWAVAALVAAGCVGARVRAMCLKAHTASLRDRGEYTYTLLGTPHERR